MGLGVLCFLPIIEHFAFDLTAARQGLWKLLSESQPKNVFGRVMEHS